MKRDGVQTALSKQILWETVRLLTSNDPTDTPRARVDVSIGGGKGIPFEEDVGWQWFAYNNGGNDQVAGCFVQLMGYIAGIWL